MVNMYIFQEGTTPIMLAAVNLLKNMHDQEEPSLEAVSSLNDLFVCTHIYVCMCVYMYIAICI